MKKEHTTLFPRSSIVFVIPSLLRRRKKGITCYYFVYTHTYTRSSLLFCFLDFFFSSFVSSLNKKRLFETLFWAFFWGPFFGGLFLHTRLLSLSLLFCWCVLVLCVYQFFWRQREREKNAPAIDRGWSTTPFGVLSLPPFSRLVRPRGLSRSPQSFLRFPLYSWESFDWKEKDPNV